MFVDVGPTNYVYSTLVPYTLGEATFNHYNLKQQEIVYTTEVNNLILHVISKNWVLQIL